MGFRSGAWMRIFEITPGERSTKVRGSISKKNKQSGQYEQDWSGFVALAGTAHRDAGKLKVNDTIKIGECDVTSRYDKEKKKEYINFSIYSFETNEEQGGASAPVPAASAAPAADTTDDEDPF